MLVFGQKGWLLFFFLPFLLHVFLTGSGVKDSFFFVFKQKDRDRFGQLWPSAVQIGSPTDFSLPSRTRALFRPLPVLPG